MQRIFVELVRTDLKTFAPRAAAASFDRVVQYDGMRGSVERTQRSSLPHRAQ
jgi:hypothetical protein